MFFNDVLTLSASDLEEHQQWSGKAGQALRSGHQHAMHVRATQGVSRMALEEKLPNGRVLLDGLGLTLERLQTGSKAAVSLPVIKAVLCAAAASLPFDREFYLRTYPDIRGAFEVGKIKDLRIHFIEFGYLEGRMGAQPEFDEDFYKSLYPDIAAAIANGEVKSALDHYIYAGSFEGRHATMETNKWWAEIFRRA